MKYIINDEVVLSRAPEGPLVVWLDRFASFTSSKGYARSSIHRQVLLAAGFSQWLKQEGIEPEGITSDHPTQYFRCRTRQFRPRQGDIAAIHAHSPQAKGRVERANRTLQDRLVKEMRLRGIDDMAAGNAYLPEFMADFNRRFAVAPRNAEDAHREVLHDARELDLILCEQHVRKLTKNLAISFEGRLYQVTGHGKGYRLRGAAVTVCKGFDGAVRVLRDGRELPVGLLAEGAELVPVEDEKTVRLRVDRAKAEQRTRPAWKPAPDHPWRRPFAPAAGADAG